MAVLECSPRCTPCHALASWVIPKVQRCCRYSCTVGPGATCLGPLRLVSRLLISPRPTSYLCFHRVCFCQQPDKQVQHPHLIEERPLGTWPRAAVSRQWLSWDLTQARLVPSAGSKSSSFGIKRVWVAVGCPGLPSYWARDNTGWRGSRGVPCLQNQGPPWEANF